MTSLLKTATSKLRSLLYSEGVNPLPTQIIVMIYILNLGSAMTMTMVFAFLPRMVKYFGASEVDAGHYAGLIGSALFMSRVIFSVFWGYLSDARGRKFALMLSAGGLGLASLAFGFSSSFYWALITRFIQGAFMGIIVITKSILADVCDETNFSLGLSILISSFSVGLMYVCISFV